VDEGRQVDGNGDNDEGRRHVDEGRRWVDFWGKVNINSFFDEGWFTRWRVNFHDMQL
jgi:hypothetical protein